MKLGEFASRHGELFDLFAWLRIRRELFLRGGFCLQHRLLVGPFGRVFAFHVLLHLVAHALGHALQFFGDIVHAGGVKVLHGLHHVLEALRSRACALHRRMLGVLSVRLLFRRALLRLFHAQLVHFTAELFGLLREFARFIELAGIFGIAGFFHELLKSLLWVSMRLLSTNQAASTG